MAIYQLQRPPPDPAKAVLIRQIATMGGWLGRRRDPIGPIVLMRGMLRLLGSLALIEEHGADALRAAGAALAEALGLPVPGVGPPLRKPRRSRQSAQINPAGH